MIDTIQVPIERFDLDAFLEGYRRLYSFWAGDDDDPDQSVTVAARFGDPPMPLYEDRDLREELLDRERLLFFHMHEPLADDTALCIDGSRELSDNFDIGVADGYGFLLEIRDSIVNVYPALYDGSSGPFPTLDLQSHCSVLDEKMKRFAESCVHSD